ncbi:hypothetical protein NPIL_637171 [Nephila pilipes]|uniref:Uncharacterized protein n=1 Tax=Nephila pilipes TaxID=299642 RepID=A0A8X6MS21_NEPPI|nr:hypothetical protein NPIL_637171 [Nephila pilipes]
MIVLKTGISDVHYIVFTDNSVKACGADIYILDLLSAQTVVLEVEEIIKSSPLTYLDAEVDSVHVTLAHFMIGRRRTSATGASYLNLQKMSLQDDESI